MKYIAYLRISTKSQRFDSQELHIQQSDLPVLAWYREIASGKDGFRPVLLNALAHAQREGCAILVSSLDRLCRSVEGLLDIKKTGVPLRCVGLPILDTQTLVSYIAIAEAERERISSRTRLGLAYAKANGNNLGRPAGLSESGKIKAAKACDLWTNTTLSASQIAREVDIARSTLYVYLAQANLSASDRPNINRLFT